MVTARSRRIIVSLERAIDVNGEPATMFELPPIPVTRESGETLGASQAGPEEQIEPRAEDIPDREAEIIDVSRMDESEYGIHLSSLTSGSVTVPMDSLRAMRDNGFCEELAPSPFNRPTIEVFQ